MSQLRTHGSGFLGRPTSLTGLLYISAAGTLISKNQMKLQTAGEASVSRPWSSWRTSFPPGSAGVTAQQGTHNREFQEVSGEL